MSDVQDQLIKEFFPSDPTEFNKRYSSKGGVGMTRQEHIDRVWFFYNGVRVGRGIYQLVYGELIGKRCQGDFELMGFKMYPTWEELAGYLKPFLASDEAFEAWWKLTPHERFYGVGVK